LKGDGLCQVSTQSRSGFPEVGYHEQKRQWGSGLCQLLGSEEQFDNCFAEMSMGLQELI
jgi:hypothetical protein